MDKPKEIKYVEPEGYFPKEIREKYFGTDEGKKGAKRRAPKKAPAEGPDGIDRWTSDGCGMFFEPKEEKSEK